MRELYLLRHAAPLVEPGVRSRDWRQSPEGIDDARRLAEIARAWRLAAVYSSGEPKMSATAAIIADAADAPVRLAEAFSELRFDRWIGNSDEFNETVRGILEQPARATRGAERAAAAAARFAAGIEEIDAASYPVSIVSGGRAIVSYLSALLRLEDPFALWRSLPMPGWLRLDLDAPPKEAPVFEALP